MKRSKVNDIELVDESLWHYFVVALLAVKKVDAEVKQKMKDEGDFRKILYKLPRGAYWSEHLVTPGDTSYLSGIISSKTFYEMIDNGFLDERKWRIDAIIWRQAKRDTLKYYQEIRYKQLLDEKNGNKT